MASFAAPERMYASSKRGYASCAAPATSARALGSGTTTNSRARICSSRRRSAWESGSPAVRRAGQVRRKQPLRPGESATPEPGCGIDPQRRAPR